MGAASTARRDRADHPRCGTSAAAAVAA